MTVIFLILVFGLAASMVAHFSTFFGVNPQQVFPGVWLLHILIFVVLIPTDIYRNKASRRQSRKDFCKAAMANTPRWMMKLVGILFAYAIFNFFVFLMLTIGGMPSEIDGRKVLENRGKIVRELTDEEYERYRAREVRGFSGHWMFFYAIGLTVQYSKLKEERDKKMEKE